MRTDGSDVRRITDFGSISWAPYEHPSGRYFFFSSNTVGSSNFELERAQIALLRATGDLANWVGVSK